MRMARRLPVDTRVRPERARICGLMAVCENATRGLCDRPQAVARAASLGLGETTYTHQVGVQFCFFVFPPTSPAAQAKARKGIERLQVTNAQLESLEMKLQEQYGACGGRGCGRRVAEEGTMALTAV